MLRDLARPGRQLVLEARPPARLGPQRPDSLRLVVDEWHPDAVREVGDVEGLCERNAHVAPARALGLDLPARALLQLHRRPIQAIDDHVADPTGAECSPPAVAAACIAAFDVLENEPQRIEQLWTNTRYFKKGLADAGFDTGISETPITPVIVGEASRAFQFSAELFNEGVLATGIGFPTVAKDRARVRTIVSATHTREELDRALDVFKLVGQRMGII